jgi:hypothetical protein
MDVRFSLEYAGGIKAGEQGSKLLPRDIDNT